MGLGNRGSESVDLPQIQTASGAADSWSASADMLLATFFPGVGDPDEDGQQRQQLESSSKHDGRELFWGELRSALYSMAVGKAPCLDGIDERMLRHVWESLGLYVKTLFDACLDRNCGWKSGGALKVRRQGERRPILVVGLHRQQYEFLRGKCTEHSLDDVKRYVNESTSSYVLGLFVNFKLVYCIRVVFGVMYRTSSTAETFYEGLNPTVYSETENVEAFFQVCEDLIHAELQPRIDQVGAGQPVEIMYGSSMSMSLASLVKALDLPPSLKEGYFPHLFNTVENSSYVGPLPDVEFYGANNMHSDHR
ncbi:hypothetical protein CBL_12338 [Carabus blaptoides fortunei]